MPIIFYIKLYITTFLVFLGIDFVWLAKIAPSFYKSNIGHLMADKPNLGAAAAFYVMNIFGLIIFAISPGLAENSAQKAAIMGALYGFATYATYDLTNYATLKDWPLKVVVVDIIWGTVLSAAVAFVSYQIATKFS